MTSKESKKQELVQVNAEIRELYAQPNADQKTLCRLYLKRALIFYHLELWELCIFDVKRVYKVEPFLVSDKKALGEILVPYLKSCCNQAHLNELCSPFIQLLVIISGNRTAKEIIHWAIRMHDTKYWYHYYNGRKRQDYFWYSDPPSGSEDTTAATINSFPGTEIRHVAGKGRGTFAIKEFQARESIGEDTSSFKLLVSDNLEDRCEHCGENIVAPNRVIYCSGCHLDKYCSQKCQLQARNTYHSYFCGKQAMQDFLGEVQRGKTASSNQGLAVLKLIGMAKQMKVKSILELPVLRMLRGTKHLKGSSLTAVMDAQLEIMAEIGDSLNPLWDLSDLMLAENMIQANSFGDVHSMSVFPVISLVNHSCNPSAKLVGHSLIALKTIKRGEEITVAYRDETGEVQRQQLWLTWEFACSCDKCDYGENLKYARMLEGGLEAGRQAYLQYLPKFAD